MARPEPQSKTPGAKPAPRRGAPAPARSGAGELRAFERLLGTLSAGFAGLSAERIDAARALAMGLGGEVVPAAELDAAIARLTEQLVSCAPDAQKAAKDLIAAVDGRPIDDAVSEETAQRIARRRATDEARDGIAAFLDKRPPAWLA